MKNKITLMEVLPCILLVLHVFFTISLPAMDPVKSLGSFQHNVWTNENGLPMNTVMVINQTADGYLWIGTEAGLARFDGINFRVFSFENTPTFSSNMIISLMADSKGTLWIVTQMGGIIQYKNRVFKPFTEYSHLLSGEIWDVMESMDGSIWIGCKTGLYRLDKEKLSRIPLPDDLSTPGIRTLLEDRNGRVWAGSRWDGLVLVKKRGDGFESEHMGLKGMEILTLFEDRKGALWVGTLDNGLFRFWGDQILGFTGENGLVNNTIFCLYEDRYANLWIGTAGGGINIFSIESTADLKSSCITTFSKPDAFTCDVIYCFYEDREGTLWIGTNGGGLYNLREAKITTYTTKNGLSYNNVYGVLQDSSGKVWVGTKGYGVNYFDPGKNRFFTLSTKDGLSSDYVVCFTQDPTGALWFGTLGGGISRLKNGSVDIYDHRHGLFNNNLRAICADPQGNIWAGTVKGGIYQFLNNGFTRIARINTRINMLLKDANQNLWACTLGSGIFCLHLTEGAIEVFNEEKGLSSNVAACIHEDEQEKGTFWIGTLKGLNRFQKGTFTALYKKDGLPDDTVYWILEDHKHDFWISSNQGICCLSRTEVNAFFKGEIQRVNPTVYGKEAGMHSVECNGGNQPAGWKTLDGKLWFPTISGISVIDPINIGVNKIPPPVVIEKMMVDGEDYPPDNTIHVPAGKNNIEIHYTALSFIVPEKIRFKYKMAGYDKTWIDADTKRRVYYTDLSPGTYRFQVIACNSDGVWNNTGAELELHLQTRFYQKPVVIVIFLLALTFSTLFLYFYNKKSGLRQKAKHKPRISTLSPAETQEYIQKLLYLIEVEKVYKDPNLSIKTLASKLVISSRNLSNIINDQLNTNFYEFVNEHRIKEARRMLSEPGPQQSSILDIAYEVGYNSKSAFNRAFKNFTNMTPSEFRKQVNK